MTVLGQGIQKLRQTDRVTDTQTDVDECITTRFLLFFLVFFMCSALGRFIILVFSVLCHFFQFCILSVVLGLSLVFSSTFLSVTFLNRKSCLRMCSIHVR